jgi:hypothetical protein
MKRTVILLAGLGLILLAGGWENSLAQNGNSILPAYAQSIDSSKVPSLQERADRNFKYVKAGPVKSGKIAGELLVGSLGAVTGGAILAFLGSETLSSDDGGIVDAGQIFGALVGYFFGSNLGSATGVCLVGNSGGEKGSFKASFGGSILGTLVGGMISAAMVRATENSGKDASGFAVILVLSGAQAGGATIAFNMSRQKKVEVPSGALFNLENGRMALALPQVDISQDSFKSGVYKVNIFKANF